MLLTSTPAGRARRASRLHLERLEDRTVPSSVPFDSLLVDTAQYDQGDLIVALQPGTRYSDLAAVAPSFVQQNSTVDLGAGLFRVNLQPGVSVAQAGAYFQAQSFVRYASPDYVVSAALTPNDPSYPQQYGLNNTGQAGGVPDADIDAPEAWDITTGSGNTIVAVIDTGVDLTHPDLINNIWTNPGEIAGNGVDDDHNGFIDDVHGWNFVANNNNPNDDNGHGSHVAGIIGAQGNNGIGVTGVNWRVQIMPVKFLNASGSGSISAAIQSLNYAVAMGAKISNNSWGGGGFVQAMLDAINNARAAGHIFVAAAGNAASNNDTTPFYPANYNVDNVVSVASTTSGDTLSSFSNFGATTVELGAPGSSIFSTYRNGGYATLSGTSMATPFVSGALALVKDLHPTWTYTQIINQILNNTDPIPALQGRTITGGRLNLFRAISAGLDTVGPKVTASTFSGAAANTFDRLRLTFSEAINPASFTSADVASFTRNGIAITGLTYTVTPVTGSNNTQFDVTFAAQSTAGTYAMTIGPNITDPSGNNMDQNSNGTKGEVPADQYTATGVIQPPADVTGPRVTSAVFSGAVSNSFDRLRVTFNEALNPGSFTGADVVSFTRNGSAITGLTYTVSAVTGSNNTQFDITFTAQTAVGTYAMTIGPNITDAAGNNMDQNNNGTNGEVPADQFTATAAITDVTGPRVISSTNSGPAAGTLDTFRVTFSESIKPQTFDASDIVSFTRNSAPIAGLTYTLTAVAGSNNTQFDIGFATQNAPGIYALTFGPSITDGADNAMDQNNNGTNGEVPGDRYIATANLGPTTGDQTFTSTDVPKTLPDVTTTNSVLNVPVHMTIGKLTARFNISHTYDSDLRISLRSPAGTTIILVNRRGGSGDNFTNTVLDDGAATSITTGVAPFTGSYRPEQALAAFNNQDAFGTWTLIVADLAFLDTGVLNSWSITVSPPLPVGPTGIGGGVPGAGRTGGILAPAGFGNSSTTGGVTAPISSTARPATTAPLLRAPNNPSGSQPLVAARAAVVVNAPASRARAADWLKFDASELLSVGAGFVDVR